MPDRKSDEESQNIPISGRTRGRKPAADPVAPADAASSAESKPQSSARQRAAAADYTPDYETPPRKSAADRPGAFNPLAWLVEGATGFVEEARHGDLGLSEDFWKHFYATRRESLLTARALIDSLLEQTEREAQKAKDRAARQKRRGTISISGQAGEDENGDAALRAKEN